MRNKKGFTLVELVIVIAVIAILAGVMIGTFASVVKKAQKSAEQQEMAAAKQEQTATDILEKLNNQNWLGWEDFEEKLAKALADLNPNTSSLTEASVKAAVASALNEYAAAHPGSDNPNTGLTEAQVKYIVENALSGQLTAAQVKAIVASAVSGTSTLTKAQVQTIIDAAVGKTLTASQVKEAVSEVIASEKLSKLTEEDLEEKLEAILSRKNYSTLTEKEIDNIIKEALKNYSVKSAEASSVKDIKDALKDEKVTNVVVSLAGDYKVVTSAPTGDADTGFKTATENAGDIEIVDVYDEKTGKHSYYKVALRITKDTVIDLDVHTLNLADAKIVVESGATLTIKGSGEIIGDGNSITVNGNGQLVIDGGDFTNERTTAAKNVAMIVADENSFLTINSGEFVTKNGSQYCVYAASNSTTVINGGTFVGTGVAANGTGTDNAVCIINGGTFTQNTMPDEPVIFWPAGTLSVYGGTFTGNATVAAICGGIVNLYGGTFTTLNKVAGACFDSGTFNSNETIAIITNRGSGYSFDRVFVGKAAKVVAAAGCETIGVYETTTKDATAKYTTSTLTKDAEGNYTITK